MNRLVALAMLLTLVAICAEIVHGENPWWIGWGSLVLAGSGFVPTMIRTVPNARRLRSAKDSAEEQSRLARAVCRDHMLSFARMVVVLCLQLWRNSNADWTIRTVPPSRAALTPSLRNAFSLSS